MALVYPPFSPLAPPLGLAILSAGVKKLGFDCRTFNWNVEFVRSYPAKRARRRVSMHRTLSYLFPLNEWVFLKQVFPDSDDNDPRIAERLTALAAGYKAIRSHKYSYQVESGLAQDPVSPSAWIPKLRGVAEDSVTRMTERLSSYDIIGISSTFAQNMAALALAKRIKTRWPEKIVVFGGANCDDIMGETLLGQFDYIDYVFSGEVDFAFPEFVRRMSVGAPVEDLPGLVYRDAHGHLAKGPAAVPLEDMNSLPLPDYDDYIADRAASDVDILPLTLTLESSRGCWWGAKHHCTFCGLNANGLAFRQKGNERFQGELEQIVQRYGPQHLSMTDNIISTSYYGAFVDWAKSRQLGIDFFYEIKANLNRSQVERLSDAGITSLQPGIESFSSGVLALMRKGIHGIQNVAFLKYASDNGVSVYYNILGGFAGEDPEDYRKMATNIRALVHLQPPAYGVGAAQYHRFSPMFREAQSELRPLPGYAELYPFPENTLSNMAYHFEAKETKEFPYFEPVSKEVQRWRESFSVRGCTLAWEAVDDTILIRDRRPGFIRQNYRLSDYAVTVFHALDRPRKLNAIGRELVVEQNPEPVVTRTEAAKPAVPPGQGLRGLRNLVADRLADEQAVSFSRDAFRANPEACLQVLVDAGVVYVDDDTYLMLPVSERRRPPQADWVSFRIPGVAERFRHLAADVRAALIDWREIALSARQT